MNGRFFHCILVFLKRIAFLFPSKRLEYGGRIYAPILLLVVGVSINSPLYAQKINSIQYTVEDGLPSSNIYQVFEDKEGYIWVTTDKGLSRFNGYTFKNFTIQDGLPSNDTWGIKQDDKGRIWVSTFNNLTYFLDNQIHTFSLKDTLLFDAPMMQEYWMAEEDAFYLLATENNTNYFLKINMRDSTQQLLKKRFEYIGYLGSKKDRKWFFNFPRNGTPYISYLLGNSTEEVTFLELNLSAYSVVNRKYVRHEQYIYFFTSNAIWQFDYQQLKKIPIESILGEDVLIEDVFPGNNTLQNLILLKTNKGYKILDESLQALHLLNESDNFYKNILEDSNGNIWLSATNGLFLITANARHSRYYPLSTNNTNNNCTAILIEDDHTIWAANQKNEIWNIKGDLVQHLQLVQKKYTSIPLKHLLKWQDYLVAAGDFGIFLLPSDAMKETVITAQSFDKMAGRPVKYLLSQGNFLPIPVKAITATDDYLLVPQWKGVSKMYIEDNILYDDVLVKGRTYASELDSENLLWLGRKNGLWYATEDTVKYVGKDKSLLQYPINDLKVDKEDNIWIATDGFGILYFNQEEVYEIEESKNSTPNRLHIDKDNLVWTATNRGVSKIKVVNTSPFTYQFSQITTAHGLIANEVNNVVVKDSIIYAATNAGLTVIDHAQQSGKDVLKLYIERLLINGKAVPNKQEYEGAYQKNNIKIEYVCLSYKSRSKITYEYQLSGIDTTWQSTTSLVREYPQLRPGEYTFKVRAIDIDGFYSATKTVQLKIRSPWWQTTWFWALSTLTLLTSGIGIFRLRVRAIQQQEAEKTRINKQFAELELQALRAQMNPHFIFNSMNAIQNFVYTKDKREASKYIVQFSRLMRLFLNASYEKFIPLKQELEILERYVELEKMRFEDKFDYEFVIDPTLPITKIQLPSLMLQPYVENAINHGLRHRKTKGQLWIRVKAQQDDTLLCEIEDNGIGRVAAQKIREQSIRKHRSRGMALVAERQRVLNHKNEQAIQIDVIDLKDDRGIALGTKVLIKIPIAK